MPDNTKAVFDLKSAALTLVALMLETSDLSVLAAELDSRFGDDAEVFDGDPIAIDLSALRDVDEIIDFEALIALLRKHRLNPVAVRGANAQQMEAARAAGLSEAQAAGPTREAAAAQLDDNVQPPVMDPVDASASDPASDPAATSAQPSASYPTTARVIDKPLRSGQQVYARGTDLVVLAVVNVGAEVIADGHIHVYAPLRGRAIAGARGNTDARIFSTRMEAQLLSIAGIYRTTEAPLSPDVLGKPAQVRLDGERLIVEPLES